MFIRLATGLMVMGGGSSSEGREFESRSSILDGHENPVEVELQKKE